MLMTPGSICVIDMLYMVLHNAYVFACQTIHGYFHSDPKSTLDPLTPYEPTSLHLLSWQLKLNKDTTLDLLNQVFWFGYFFFNIFPCIEMMIAGIIMIMIWTSVNVFCCQFASILANIFYSLFKVFIISSWFNNWGNVVVCCCISRNIFMCP